MPHDDLCRFDHMHDAGGALTNHQAGYKVSPLCSLAGMLNVPLDFVLDRARGRSSESTMNETRLFKSEMASPL